MEKVEIKIKQTEDHTHHFYCDNCGVRIGSSREYDDGWYQTLGDLELEFYVPTGWYSVKKCLCDQCEEKYLSEVYTTLEQLGFKKENDND